MIAQALSLGFSTGLFCLANCVPTLTPLLLLSPRKGFRAGLGMVGLFLSGRLLTYCVLGLLAGLAGNLGGNLPYSTPFLALTQLVLGGMLVAQVFLRRPGRHCRGAQLAFGSRKTVFLAGVLTSATLCPPLLLACSMAWENGTPWRGVVFFLFFFLATSLYVLPVAVASWKFHHWLILRLSKIICAGTGVYFLFRGLSIAFLDNYVVY